MMPECRSALEIQFRAPAQHVDAIVGTAARENGGVGIGDMRVVEVEAQI